MGKIKGTEKGEMYKHLELLLLEKQNYASRVQNDTVVINTVF